MCLLIFWSMTLWLNIYFSYISNIEQKYTLLSRSGEIDVRQWTLTEYKMCDV